MADGDAAPAPLPANKACHNCRRQRLRCDRSVPTCHKCTAAGRECLGYGQLLRWTGAVASRGKLAGRTSSAPVDSRHSPPPPPSPPSDPSGSVCVCVTCSRRSAPHWVLVDPIFQHLGPSHRYYLSYFSHRLCKDLVAHDGPDCNPFRSLIALTGHQPLLRYIIVAASAAHVSVLYRSATGCSAGASSRAALDDALVAKHQALRLMVAALHEDVTATGGDVLLAAALFFVNVELIESGKHGWRAHLQGACRILDLIQNMKPWDSALRDYLLSDCFMQVGNRFDMPPCSAWLICANGMDALLSSYFILATVFTPPAQGAIDFEASQIPLVLSRTTSNSYFCCPPQILEILHAASRLFSDPSRSDDGRDDDHEITASALALLDRAQALDVAAWAASSSPQHHRHQRHHAHRQSRIRVGSAHRCAACLYILQAMPEDPQSVRLTQALRDQLFDHLAHVPDDDANFKATSWPTFIAGAEAVGGERRDWIMDRLRRLVAHCPWGFIYTAMDTLPILWSTAGRGSWVQVLQNPALNFLIV